MLLDGAARQRHRQAGSSGSRQQEQMAVAGLVRCWFVLAGSLWLVRSGWFALVLVRSGSRQAAARQAGSSAACLPFCCLTAVLLPTSCAAALLPASSHQQAAAAPAAADNGRQWPPPAVNSHRGCLVIFFLINRPRIRVRWARVGIGCTWCVLKWPGFQVRNFGYKVLPLSTRTVRRLSWVINHSQVGREK